MFSAAKAFSSFLSRIDSILQKLRRLESHRAAVIEHFSDSLGGSIDQSRPLLPNRKVSEAFKVHFVPAEDGGFDAFEEQIDELDQIILLHVGVSQSELFKKLALIDAASHCGSPS